VTKIVTDPFLGRCIHGRPGATIQGASKVSPECEHCNPEADEDKPPARAK